MSDNKKEINEKELDNVNGGMKIILIDKNIKLLEQLKNIIEKIKKKQK